MNLTFGVLYVKSRHFHLFCTHCQLEVLNIVILMFPMNRVMPKFQKEINLIEREENLSKTCGGGGKVLTTFVH